MKAQELRIGNYVEKPFMGMTLPYVIASGADIDNANIYRPAKLCNVLLDRTMEWYEPLRHWRGNGQVIADVMRDWYYDYPKRSMNRNARRHTLAECIVQVISQDEYLERMLKEGVEHHNRMVKRHQLGNWNLIKES